MTGFYTAAGVSPSGCGLPYARLPVVPAKDDEQSSRDSDRVTGQQDHGHIDRSAAAGQNIRRRSVTDRSAVSGLAVDGWGRPVTERSPQPHRDRSPASGHSAGHGQGRRRSPVTDPLNESTVSYPQVGRGHPGHTRSPAETNGDRRSVTGGQRQDDDRSQGRSDRDRSVFGHGHEPGQPVTGHGQQDGQNSAGHGQRTRSAGERSLAGQHPVTVTDPKSDHENVVTGQPVTTVSPVSAVTVSRPGHSPAAKNGPVSDRLVTGDRDRSPGGRHTHSRRNGSVMKHSPWRFAPYGIVATGAIAGQISAGANYLRPTFWLQVVMIVLVAFAIEGGAVWMAYLAKKRGELGENATPFFVISSLFAVLATVINVAGHWGNLWAVAGFGGLSLAGYVIWCFDLRALLEDSWDKDGTIRERTPSHMILMKLTKDAAVAERARTIALIHAEANRGAPGMGPSQAIAAARAELAMEERRAGIAAAIREQMKADGASDIDIKLAMLTYGAEDIANEMMRLAANGGMAAALNTRILPKRLTGVDPNRAGKGGRPPAPGAEPPVIEGDFEEGQPPHEVREEKPRRAITTGSRGQDPWDKFAPLLKAIMDNEADWFGRPTALPVSQIEGALAHAVANGVLDKADVPTSKPYLLKLRWMIEALSSRPVPDEQWGKSLAGVDRERVQEQREVHGITG